MAEYKERRAAHDAVVDAIWHGKRSMYSVSGAINSVPTADVAPVRHGRWLFVTAGQMTSAWCCSECGRTVVITCDEELRQSKLEKEYPFCHCGAMMDLEVQDGKRRSNSDS